MTTTAAGEQRPPVVGFVGPSGVGKTTLLERLIPGLTARGLAVGVVKHASHGFLADRPGKDSFRVYESGASAVALISSEQIATFVRAEPRVEEKVTLTRALATLPPGLDLLLAEGFSWEPIPRVVLFCRGREPTREHSECGEVIERICVSRPRPGQRPEFSEALIASLIRLLGERVAALDEVSVMTCDLERSAEGCLRRSPS